MALRKSAVRIRLAPFFKLQTWRIEYAAPSGERGYTSETRLRGFNFLVFSFSLVSRFSLQGSAL